MLQKFLCKLIMLYLCAFVITHAFTVKRDTLDNGLVVIMSEAHKIPMIEMKVIIKAGSVFDPQGKEGLANLVSRLLLRGTESKTGDELIADIEYLGAEINSDASEDYSEISVRALSKDLPFLLGTITDCLRRPLFDKTEFSRLQRRTYSEIISQSDDPFYAGEVRFRLLLFGTHPLNHMPIGFDSTVQRITIADVKDFYDKYYAPNNSIIVLVGDFNPDSILELVKTHFGTWQRKVYSDPTVPQPSINQRAGVIIKRDISQSYIFIGSAGPDYYAEDWIQTRLMNYILGGSGLTSRLAAEIREKRGLAYDAFSYFARFRVGGYFVAGAQTKNESAEEAIELIVNEIGRMPLDITIDELNRAKKYYMGNFPLTFDTYRELANLLVRIEIEGLGLDYPQKFEKMVADVTLQDVLGAAKKYLQPDNLSIVIVGNMAESQIRIDGIEWVR